MNENVRLSDAGQGFIYKMIIVYCIPSLYSQGGMEKVLTVKANYLTRKFGYSVHIVTTDMQGRSPYYKLDSSVILTDLGIGFEQDRKLSLFRRILGSYKKRRIYKKRLGEFLQKIKPDITVSLLRREIDFLTSLKDGSKKIGEIHFTRESYRNLNLSCLPFRVNRYLSKKWMDSLVKKIRKLDKFVVLTELDKRKWGGLKNITVISNPVEYFPDRISDVSSKRVIAAGRYSREKGFDLLIKSWKTVAEKYMDWHLYIYGTGENDLYQQMAEEIGVGNSVHCETSVRNLPEKMLESSIFVLSSRYEGFSLVLAEAMSCGLPAVSFACPCGPQEIITNGEDGILVEPENTEQLAEEICRMIRDSALREKMGRKARVNVERYAPDKIMVEWKKLFAEVLLEKK